MTTTATTAQHLEHAIPPITHPLGRSWDQPDRLRILIDDTHALMSQQDFDDLHEYSSTMPTGVYEGKMWKANPRPDVWLLRWYGVSDKPDHVSNNQRRILIV